MHSHHEALLALVVPAIVLGPDILRRIVRRPKGR